MDEMERIRAHSLSQGTVRDNRAKLFYLGYCIASGIETICLLVSLNKCHNVDGCG